MTTPTPASVALLGHLVRPHHPLITPPHTLPQYTAHTRLHTCSCTLLLSPPSYLDAPYTLAHAWPPPAPGPLPPAPPGTTRPPPPHLPPLRPSRCRLLQLRQQQQQQCAGGHSGGCVAGRGPAPARAAGVLRRHVHTHTSQVPADDAPRPAAHTTAAGQCGGTPGSGAAGTAGAGAGQ